MSDLDRLQLPLQPAGGSLASHIAALDLLAARLDALPSRPSWPARVPINSKASFDGDITHTNKVKVHVGGEWWVEMTAHEAAEYVRRRRQTLLEDHARVTEGQKVEPHTVDKPGPQPGQRVLQTSEITFDPLFAHPVTQGVKRQEEPPSEDVVELATPGAAAAAAANASRDAEPEPQVSRLVDEDGNEVELPESLQNLVDLVGEHLHDKLHIPNGGSEGGADGTTVNEDGLPIHEIREDADGRTLGPVPQGSGEGSIEMRDPEKDDYWTDEAAARRAALRRRIFHEGSDSDTEEDEDGMDVDEPTPENVPERSASNGQPLRSAMSAPSAGLAVPDAGGATTPTSPTASMSASMSSLSPNRAPRSPAQQPKSILKAPIRKKSVTFDKSVPIPPDSPPPKRHGVPLDKIFASRPVDETTGPAPIPILKSPIPGRKKGPDSFGGLRSGFLGSGGASPIVSLAPEVTPGKVAPPKIPTAKITEIPDDAAAGSKNEPKRVPTPPAPAVPAASDAMDVDVKDEASDDKPKKKSLFAQRRAGGPSFPKQSASEPMTTMRPSVVEKPSEPRTSASPAVPPTVGAVGEDSSGSSAPVVVVDDDEDPDDYGDLGEFSDDEEDEYALDEALLAREVALEFHKRQGWQRPIDEDEVDPEAADAAGSGGVVMGIPRVSSITGGTGDDDKPLRIVNPTADDLSQFLRVGRSEDGELVFEPPVINSDSETDGEANDDAARDRRARRAKRHDVMNRLRSGNYDETPAGPTPADLQARADQYTASLPPAVQAAAPAQPAAAPAPTPSAVPAKHARPDARDVVERVAPADAAAAPPPEPPKKVSRFKAARMQQ